MARKSRKNMMPQAVVQEAVQQNEKELLRTAAYARLSVENGGHETEDSLHTQILQIHNYIRENPELTLTDTYADNGFTGTRFDRPEFERMMQDVRTGKIQCIVVKDLSRFGRDYIETGSYLETIFPMLHVRFIAINDDFDNIRQSDVDSLAVPIKNMVNSLYAKDISKKISLSYQMRREKGIPTSWCTPYGYQLNQQGNKFEATEDAKWVKLIYQWYLAGVSTNEIARRLEFLEVARPNERLNRKLHEGDDPTYNKWHPSTVLRILNSSEVECIKLSTSKSSVDTSRALAISTKASRLGRLIADSITLICFRVMLSCSPRASCVIPACFRAFEMRLPKAL